MMKIQKDNIIDLVMKHDNSNILNELENLLFKYHVEKQESTPMTEEELIAELKLALDDVKAGRLTSTAQLKEEVNSWQ